MEYRIEADTTYDYEAYKALGKLYSRIIYKYRRLAGLFLGTLLLCGGVTLLLKRSLDGILLIYPVLMAVLGAIILVLSLMLDRYMISSVTRNGESQSIDVTNHFFFTDNELTIQNDRAVRTHTYAKLYRVYETNEYIFFFTGKRSFLMLRKSQITKGTPMALRNLVSAHAPRYILCQGL